MSTITIDPRPAQFLEALKAADANAFCSPPGLGGTWRVAHIRSGFSQKVLMVHSGGKGLAFAPFPASHRAKECRCSHCVWEYAASEPNSPPVSAARIKTLVRRLQTLEMGKRPEVSLD